MSLIAMTCQAEDFINLGGLSHHPDNRELNEINPGFGYQTDFHARPPMETDVLYGVYHNSHKNISFYAALEMSFLNSRICHGGILFGAATGYPSMPLSTTPIIGPNVRCRLSEGISARVAYLPAAENEAYLLQALFNLGK